MPLCTVYGGFRSMVVAELVVATETAWLQSWKYFYLSLCGKPFADCWLRCLHCVYYPAQSCWFSLCQAGLIIYRRFQMLQLWLRRVFLMLIYLLCFILAMRINIRLACANKSFILQLIKGLLWSRGFSTRVSLELQPIVLLTCFPFVFCYLYYSWMETY